MIFFNGALTLYDPIIYVWRSHEQIERVNLTSEAHRFQVVVDPDEFGRDAKIEVIELNEETKD